MKSDKELQKDVLDELSWDPRITVSDIGVAVKGGVVTLTGSVPYYAEKCAAEEAARRVAGVKAVAEEIQVEPAGPPIRSDAEIAREAANALGWNVYVPDNKVKVTVDKGWITLDGQVDWEFQRKAAFEAVRYWPGVKGVTNHITITSKVSAVEVKEKIRKAIERDAELDARNIKVETSNGTVKLSGKVRSWAERQEAATTAWSAPGVTEVKNDIEISYV